MRNLGSKGEYGPTVDVLPSTGNFPGRTAVLSTDGKAYRYEGGAWLKESGGGSGSATALAALPLNNTVWYGAYYGDQSFAQPGYWRDVSGVVRIRGLIVNNAAYSGNGVVAVLPVGFRPAKAETRVVQTSSGPVRCDVYADGSVLVYGNFNAGSWFSLGGVSFEAAEGPYVTTVAESVAHYTVGQGNAPAFGTGWTNYPGSVFEPVGYSLAASGLVVLRGVAQRASGTGVTVFTLPVGARPRGRRMFTGIAGVGNSQGWARVEVWQSGEVQWQAGQGVEYFGLDGISFYAGQ